MEVYLVVQARLALRSLRLYRDRVRGRGFLFSISSINTGEGASQERIIMGLFRWTRVLTRQDRLLPNRKWTPPLASSCTISSLRETIRWDLPLLNRVASPLARSSGSTVVIFIACFIMANQCRKFERKHAVERKKRDRGWNGEKVSSIPETSEKVPVNLVFQRI